MQSSSTKNSFDTSILEDMDYSDYLINKYEIKGKHRFRGERFIYFSFGKTSMSL
jgi:hypothetical protein